MNEPDAGIRVADLTAWRDAVIAGDLPTPGREDRWQPLRGGVVGMWEFEVAEYWFADGRAQFMGRNESGKSSLMTLTSLILLAGDTGPHLVDTLGGKKKFRYYVEPTTDDEDRRDTSKSTHRGWAWLEFGRLTQDGPQFLTALLYAQAKRAEPRVPLIWVVCEGPERVRSGITLIRANAVVPPGEACSGPGWRAYANNGGIYREHLARALFGTTADRLEGYVRLLKVIRTPKLGKNLNLPFLVENLREALPPLAEHEVAQLADGWDELDRIAADRDSADEARNAVDAFMRTAWRPWASAEVRKVADAVVTATTDFDAVTRSARNASDDLTAATKRLEKLDKAITKTTGKREGMISQADAIRESQRYKNAETALHSAAQLSKHADKLRSIAGDRTREAAEDGTEAEELAERAKAQEANVSAAATRRHDVTVTVSRHAADLGLPDAAAWIASDDVERLAQGQRERRGHVREMDMRLRTEVDADAELGRRQENLAAAQEEDRIASETFKARKAQAEGESQQVVDALGSWSTARDPQPAAHQVEHWTTLISQIAEVEHPAPVLASRVEDSYLAPRRSELTVALKVAEATAKESFDRAHRLDEKIHKLRTQPDPAPAEPPFWVRRARPAYPSTVGSPLWRLLDPAEGIGDDVVDRIEAGLAAVGLLDAWVTADGIWRDDRDGSDIVVSLNGPTATRNLHEVLRVADDAGDLAGSVSAFLAATAWTAHGALDQQTAFALAADGRWRTATASGRASPPDGGASLLGAAAQRRSLERRIAGLEHDRDVQLEVATDEEKRASRLQSDLDEVAEAARVLPTDQTLVSLVLALRSAEARVEEVLRKLGAAQDRALDAETDALNAHAAAASWAAEHALPRKRAELDAMGARVDRLADLIGDLRTALGEHGTAVAVAAEVVGRAEVARRRAAEAEARARKAEEEASGAETKAQAARDALSGATQELLDRVAGLTKGIQRLDQRLETMRTERDSFNETRIKAEGALADRERDADNARRQREVATNAWWVVQDSGIPASLGVADPSGRTITGALDASRAARKTLRLADWPEGDPEEQSRRISRAWKKLTDDSTQLRAVLEAGAGRTIRLTDVDEDQLPRIEIVVDGTGQGHDPPAAVTKLAEQHAELQQSYDESMHRTLHELLGSTFIEHLRDRLVEVETLQATTNRILAEHPTGTTRTMLRLTRVPVEGDPHAAEVLAALQTSSYELLSEEAQEQIRYFLRNRIDEARDAARTAGDVDWQGRLAKALDYRAWFAWAIEKRAGEEGRWRPLTTGSHGKLSGGASVVTLMLPLVATLAAMYQSTLSGPRPLWLDEAFDGVDRDNRSSVLDLLREFDTDYLLAGPSLLLNTATVPSAAIWEVVRAEHPLPGADLTLMLWAGRQLTLIDLPDPADVARRSAQEMTSPA